jgi:hypothetical protein
MRRGVWIIRAAAFGLVFFTVVGLLTMALWNAIVPQLFAAPAINFWQALGLLLLGRLITGNIGPRGRYGYGGAPWMRRRGGPWRERWQQMSAEERQQVMERWRGRGGYCPPYPHEEAQGQRTDPNPSISES